MNTLKRRSRLVSFLTPQLVRNALLLPMLAVSASALLGLVSFTNRLNTMNASVTESALQPPRPEMARYGEAYTGTKGLRVYVSPMANSKSALVQVAYVNHPWDKQIFLCEVERVRSASGVRLQYSHRVEGSNYTMLITYADGSGELYLQNEADDVRRLGYNEAESRELNNEHQLTAHQEQQDKARQALREQQRKK
jgi:hypothetical protein